ncbi:MAG: phenylalanine--tRNA ligase subunit beta [bacterium]|nr:phenylalanine--tRNA ligase subunit beta [bacterium]
MRVPLSWLKDYVDITLPVDDLVHRMTMAGLQVDSVEYVGRHWQRDKLFVGEVVEVKPHPDAERLVLALVAYGQDAPQTVVTGAPNIQPGDRGQKVAFAIAGAKLWDAYSEEPRLRTLKRARIRGVESSGMVCSEKELGLSDEHTGVLILDPQAPVGQPLQDVLGDTVLDIDLTPNLARASCIIGMAREIAALTNQSLRQPWPPTDPLLSGSFTAQTAYVTVSSADLELCPRYSAALIENVTIEPSPPWMQRRLQLAGMRPINNIVDITNYCMFETGQPLHAFDYETLSLDGGIVVRSAQAGERLHTLDEVDRTLTPEMLLITDDSGPIALAGVMGGAATEISAQTRHILLESANFNFINIRRTLQQLRLSSEAGQRFGRGLDSELTLPALVRASRLMEELSGGALQPEIADTYPKPPSPKTITLRTAQVTRSLGMDFSIEDISQMLSRLDFTCLAHLQEGDPHLEIGVPSYRLDVSIEADLIEEVARMHGYDNIPLSLINDVLPPQRSQPLLEGLEQTRNILVGCGLTEILSYAMTSLESINRARPDAAAANPEDYIRLANPISQEREFLRQTLLPSMFETLRANRRYRQRMLLFEIGRVYLPEPGQDLPLEQRWLAMAVTGTVQPASWHQGKEVPLLGFTHLKGVLETLVQRLNVPNLRFHTTQHPTLAAGKTAALEVGGDTVGIVGEVHPQVCERFDLPEQPIAMLELNLDLLLAHRQPRRYQAISRFPAVLEDMALVVDVDTPAQAVEDAIRTTAGDLLRHIELFDLYQGEPIPSGKKSLAYALTFQAEDRSLTEDEIRAIYQRIQQHTAAELGAQPRQ